MAENAPALRADIGVLDDIISKELSTSVAPSAKEDLARYQEAGTPYSALRQASKAANAARGIGGQFVP